MHVHVPDVRECVWFLRTCSDHLTTLDATHAHVRSNYGNGIRVSVLINQIFAIGRINCTRTLDSRNMNVCV